MLITKMASSKYKEKLEDVFLCVVCACPFDDSEKKPKILTSCFHTLCLACIMKMYSGSSILCPFCRKQTNITTMVVNGEVKATVNKLPNNTYVLSSLHALSSLDRRSETSQRWCLACGKEANKFCKQMPAHMHHNTILIDSASPRECCELQEKMDSMEHLQDSIILKRKETSFSLEQLSNSLAEVSDGIKNKKDQNDARLKLIINLKAAARTIDPEAVTVKSLRFTVDESLEITSEDLNDVQQLEENYLDQLKTAVKTFQSNLKIQKKFSTEEFNRISFQDYLFRLEFTRAGQNLGSIQIKPDEAFYRPFINRLARFCHQSPMVFGSSIVKSFPNGYATFGFFHKDFTQDVPDPANFHEAASNRKVSSKLDVGFLESSYAGNSIIEFQLVLQIQDRMRKCPLFGVIVEGSDVIDVLSKKPPKERGAFEVSIQILKRDD